MMRKFVRSFVVAGLCAGHVLLFSCRPKIIAVSGLEGKTFSSGIKETWGYGCGKDCSFNSDGSDAVELTFGLEDGEVRMSNLGQYINVIHYPHSFILDAKKWSYDYSGLRSNIKDAVELRLKLEKAECSVQRAEGKRKLTLPCEKPKRERMFRCKADRVDVSGSSTEALVCTDEEENQMVFGIGTPIVKVIVGEPSIKTYFYTQAAVNK